MVASFALLGLLLGAMAAFVLSRIDKRVRRPEDVERSLNLPVLASLGERPGRRGRSQEVSLQVLAARLLVATRSTPGRTIALASAVEGPDSTGVTLRLAKAIAERGVRVCLVGATSWPAGTALDPSLTMIDLSQHGATGDPDRVRSVLDKARASSAAVLLSAPGTLNSPETLLLAAEADAVVLLAQTGVTRMDDLLDATSALEEMGSTIIGVVLDGPDRGQRKSTPPDAASGGRGRGAAAPEPADAR